jgi:hypothetical protein
MLITRTPKPLGSVDSVPYILVKPTEKTNRFAWNHTGFLEIYVPVAAFYTYLCLPTIKFICNFKNKGEKKALYSHLECQRCKCTRPSLFLTEIIRLLAIIGDLTRAFWYISL